MEAERERWFHVATKGGGLDARFTAYGWGHNARTNKHTGVALCGATLEQGEGESLRAAKGGAAVADAQTHAGQSGTATQERMAAMCPGCRAALAVAP